MDYNPKVKSLSVGGKEKNSIKWLCPYFVVFVQLTEIFYRVDYLTNYSIFIMHTFQTLFFLLRKDH